MLQGGQWLIKPPAGASDHAALLVQPNIPIVAEWTSDYFQTTIYDLAQLSLRSAKERQGQPYDLIVWPESPSPFFTNDARFRDPVSAWPGNRGVGWSRAPSASRRRRRRQRSQIFNSAELVSPQGDWTARYDKVHLVPFGEYLPFPQVFGFAGGLTKEVGEFQHGSSRAPARCRCRAARERSSATNRFSRRGAADLPADGRAGAGEYFKRRLVWR